ncbi:hypothetical protein FB451DRAFT_1186907 [Mycena latifolia]|nr:hypothetical protein FB451DRAFT_1186907 [Mycena latifolia]
MTVDLLRNRNPQAGLGPFDGKVTAFAELGVEHYFITTNADYVPAVPSLQLPHALFLRSDMCALLPFACHSPEGTRPELDMMWWDPSPADFIIGSAVTRGLGRLYFKRMAQFLPPINKLVTLCKELQLKSPTPISPLFGELVQTIFMWFEQLQSLPTTYKKMVFGVTSLQRTFVELNALYNYTTVYKPRMDNYMTSTSAKIPVAACVSAFTTVPSVAQQLYAARLPFWFLQPTFVFDTENILAVVTLRQPSFFIPDDTPGDGTPPAVYSGNSTSEKIQSTPS